MRPRTALTGVAAVLGGLALGAAAPQDPAPARPGGQLTFRAVANYVEIDAIVTDAQGRFIRDLTIDDFEVAEDGVRQDLSVCDVVEIPIDRGDRPLYRSAGVDPDVATNTRPFDGRLYVLLLDGYHVAAHRSASARRHARVFIERFMGANDLATVVHIGNPAAGQEFTSNKTLLLASVDRFIGQKLRSTAVNRLESELANQDIDLGAADYEDPLRAFMAIETLTALERLSWSLAGLSGRRKTVLMFSEGIDYNTDDRQPELVEVRGRPVRVAIRDAELVLEAQRHMLAAASRANVSIYPIDPRGVATGFEDLIFISALPAGGAPPVERMGRELQIAHEALRTFADQTGGRAMINATDPAPGFARVVQDNSSYYILGYNTANVQRDGRFRYVTVRVKRPGLEVRARRGYYAPSDRSRAGGPRPSAATEDTVTSLLGAPAAVGGLGMRINAAAFRAADTKAVVHLTVEFTGRDLAFAEQEEVFANDVEVALRAVDPDGRVVSGDRRTIRLRLRPATRDNVTRRGLRFLTEFELPPGRYQLRVAGLERTGGRFGSVFQDLVVPDFGRGPIAMSDVLITSPAAGAMLTSGAAPAMARALPGPVTTVREWVRGDQLAVFAEVYDNDAARPHTVDIRAVVRNEDGRTVFAHDEPRDSREIGAARGAFGYLARVPLEGLAAGRYVLTVEARSRLGGPLVQREVAFSLR